tara:strand:- start:289 stop:783 length:495 start_codon:yes stop_codon:yes gene_type:complete
MEEDERPTRKKMVFSIIENGKAVSESSESFNSLEAASFYPGQTVTIHTEIPADAEQKGCALYFEIVWDGSLEPACTVDDTRSKNGDEKKLTVRVSFRRIKKDQKKFDFETVLPGFAGKYTMKYVYMWKGEAGGKKARYRHQPCRETISFSIVPPPDLVKVIYSL